MSHMYAIVLDRHVPNSLQKSYNVLNNHDRDFYIGHCFSPECLKVDKRFLLECLLGIALFSLNMPVHLHPIFECFATFFTSIA